MLLPRSDLRAEGRCVIDSTVEILPFEDSQPDLGHVQRTALLGRVVELDPVEVRLSFIQWEELIEDSGIVRVALIDHYPDADCIRVVDICEVNHPGDELGGASPLGDRDGNPASQRFGGTVKRIASCMSANGFPRSMQLENLDRMH